MKKLSIIALAMPLIFASPAFAVDEHHPEKTPAAPAVATPVAPASPDVPATVKQMQGNVKKMQAQLDRIAKAKTADVRQKVIAEHMQTMQENMRLAGGMMGKDMDCAAMHGAMMGGAMMGGGAAAEGMPERMQMMEKRMDMMERMMQGQPAMKDPTPAR